MTGMQLLVVIVFLLLGYWIMSAVLNWLSQADAKSRERSGRGDGSEVDETPSRGRSSRPTKPR